LEDIFDDFSCLILYNLDSKEQGEYKASLHNEVMRMDKKTAWDFALGLIKVDGLEPTPEFLEMVEKEKRGEMSLDDIERELGKHYRMKGDLVLSKSMTS